MPDPQEVQNAKNQLVEFLQRNPNNPAAQKILSDMSKQGIVPGIQARQMMERSLQQPKRPIGTPQHPLQVNPRTKAIRRK